MDLARVITGCRQCVRSFSIRRHAAKAQPAILISSRSAPCTFNPLQSVVKFQHTQALVGLSGQRIVKRPQRKKIPSQERPGAYTAHAFATADEYDLAKALKVIEKQGLYEKKSLPSDVLDAVYLTAKYLIDKEPRDIILFRQGSVVFWNVPVDEQHNFMKMLREFEEDSYDSKLVRHESESVEYAHSGEEEVAVITRMKNDLLMFAHPSEDIILEKYSYSNGLMLSVKLAIWEATLEDYINTIEYVTENLKEGKLSMSRKEVLQKTGELYTLSHFINLSSHLLDTPDFYWDRDELEKLYHQSTNYFNIKSRTAVMNKKLAHCIDLVDLLRDYLNTKHEVRLEWMIIILILVEVMFEFLHKWERYQDKKSQKDATTVESRDAV